jgi:hypothetical protein
MIEEEEKQGRPTGRLEKWWRSKSRGGRDVLVGDVYDDVRDRFLDGTFIHTSQIKDTDQCFEEGSTIKTTYSTYYLGAKFTGHDEVNHDQG